MVQKARTTNTADEARRERAMGIMTAPGWNPEPGESLSGVVVSSRTQESEWENPDGGLFYPVFVYELDDKPGEFVAVHAFHSLLYKELKRQQTKVGSHQMISHGGSTLKSKSKKNGVTMDNAGPKDKYVHYAVLDLDNPEEGQEFNWGDKSSTSEPDF